MTRAERGQRFEAKERRIAKEYSEGCHGGDVYRDGKPVPRESVEQTTIAMMDRLAELNKESAHAVK